MDCLWQLPMLNYEFLAHCMFPFTVSVVPLLFPETGASLVTWQCSVELEFGSRTSFCTYTFSLGDK